MGKVIMIDQYHVSLFIPKRLSERATHRIERRIGRPRFRQEVARAIRAVFRQYEDLKEVRLFFSL